MRHAAVYNLDERIERARARGNEFSPVRPVARGFPGALPR